MRTASAVLGLACLALGTSLVVLSPGRAVASGGGPCLVRVLGHDVADRKVFYLVECNDESGEFDGLWYFDLNARDPTQAIRARSFDPRPREHFDAHARRVARLESRLAPLDPVQLMGIGLVAVVLAEDSMGSAPCRHFRVKVTLTGPRRGYGRAPFFDPVSFDCDSYTEPRVILASAQETGGFLLLVVAYRGVPREECYEYHRAILVPLKGRGPPP